MAFLILVTKRNSIYPVEKVGGEKREEEGRKAPQKPDVQVSGPLSFIPERFTWTET